MALTLSRIDRKPRTYALTDVLTGTVPPGVTGVDVALLPPRTAPTAATAWVAATYAAGSFSVLLAGPDADPTGAIVVPASADLWMRITNLPQVEAEKVERITVLGGGPLPAVPVDRGLPAGGTTGQVLTKASNSAYDTTWSAAAGGGGAVASVNTKTGAVVLTADDIADGTTRKTLTAAERTKLAGLATVATSGAYADLTGKPTIPATPADIGAQPAGSYATPTDLLLKAPYRAGLFTAPAQQVTVVSTMDSGWTHLDTGTAVHDTTIFDTGTGSLKITAPGAAGAGKSTAWLPFTAQNWADQAFGFRFRTDDWANIIDGYLLASTSGVLAQFFRVQITPKMARVVNNEWSEITLTRGDFAFNSGTANWGTVNGLAFQLYSATGTTPSLWIDQFIRYTTPARPTISFAFDDGFASTITDAKPILDKYGYRGSAYLMPTVIGTSAYMTQAQIDTLAAQGWDLGGHGVNDLTTLSFAAAEADVQATKAYILDRGYKGGDVYAYPLGGQSVALRAMVGKYFNAARGTSTFGQTRGYVNRHNMTTRQLGTGITVADVQGWVDQAVAGNEWLILTGHKLTASPVTPEDFSIANFGTVVDYVAASGAQVLPVSEALAQVDAAASTVTLASPNGTRYRLTVGNDGALTTTAV